MFVCSLHRQCGYPHDSLSFLSSGNVMLLTLVTSEKKNFPGFRANYSQIPLTEQSTTADPDAAVTPHGDFLCNLYCCSLWCWSHSALLTSNVPMWLVLSFRVWSCADGRQRLLLVTFLSLQLSSKNHVCLEYWGASTFHSHKPNTDDWTALWSAQGADYVKCVLMVVPDITSRARPIFGANADTNIGK